MNKETGYKVVIGVLIAVLLIQNLVIPFVNKKRAEKQGAQVAALVPQLNKTTDQKAKQVVALQIADAAQVSKLLQGVPASANIGYTATNGASTTGGCENFMIAYRGVIQLFFDHGISWGDQVAITSQLSAAYNQCLSAS